MDQKRTGPETTQHRVEVYAQYAPVATYPGAGPGVSELPHLQRNYQARCSCGYVGRLMTGIHGKKDAENDGDEHIIGAVAGER